jgi:uncharacterized protein (TIRG00374 family)
MPRLTVKTGLSLFLLFTVAGLIGVFFYTTSLESLPAILARVDPIFVLACLIGVPVADWLIAGLRMYVFAGLVAPKVSYAACVRNCAVGGFMTAATPSQTGGGIAQAYVLVKEGASLGQAISILCMTFLSSLVFYFVLGLAMWGLAIGNLVRGIEVSAPFVVAVGLFGILTTLGFAMLVLPAAARRWLGRATAWLEARGLPRWAAERVNEVLDEFSESVRVLARRHRLRFTVSVLLSILMFGNKYFAGYLAARALGLHPPLVELMVVQAFINLLLYFFPTPGSSGGAEVTTAVLMSRLVPEPMLGPFTALSRTATLYLSVLVGGLILLRYLRREASPGYGAAIEQ